jgi:hypothetical protein
MNCKLNLLSLKRANSEARLNLNRGQACDLRFLVKPNRESSDVKFATRLMQESSHRA